MFKTLMICALIGVAMGLTTGRKPVAHAEHVVERVVEHHGGGVNAEDVHADVVSRKDDVRPDGFDAVLETSNHISRSDSGDEHGNIHGSYGWISPEGVHIQVQYVADENGVHATGEHIPTIPDYIQRSIEWNAAHPHEEENDH